MKSNGNPPQQNASGPQVRAGLYIHIPFCARKCRYCDFFSVTDLQRIHPFLQSLLLEMDLVSTDWADLTFDSIYLGGGTPSLLSLKAIDAIFAHAGRRFRMSGEVEVTMEVNPGTVAPGSFHGYKHSGVNRLNIGVQSFNSLNLSFLGRIHSVGEAVSALKDARKAGFDNIGMDLIYGLPEQTEKSWLIDLKKAVSFEMEHLSCYLLSYEPGTALLDKKERGFLNPMPQEAQARLFEATSEFLEANGFEHYEVSNFAKMPNPFLKARRSRHNQKYWDFLPYLGLGPGAHSFRGNQRTWNEKNLDEYMKRISSGRRPPGGVEDLSSIQQRMEGIYLGLRRREGILFSEYEKRFGFSLCDAITPTANLLKKEGLADFSPDGIRLTRHGMVFLDSIAESLIAPLPS